MLLNWNMIKTNCLIVPTSIIHCFQAWVATIFDLIPMVTDPPVITSFITNKSKQDSISGLTWATFKMTKFNLTWTVSSTYLPKNFQLGFVEKNQWEHWNYFHCTCDCTWVFLSFRSCFGSCSEVIILCCSHFV